MHSLYHGSCACKPVTVAMRETRARQVLGKKVGKALGKVKAALAAMGPAEIAAFERDGAADVAGERLELGDIRARPPPPRMPPACPAGAHAAGLRCAHAGQSREAVCLQSWGCAATRESVRAAQVCQPRSHGPARACARPGCARRPPCSLPLHGAIESARGRWCGPSACPRAPARRTWTPPATPTAACWSSWTCAPTTTSRPPASRARRGARAAALPAHTAPAAQPLPVFAVDGGGAAAVDCFGPDCAPWRARPRPARLYAARAGDEPHSEAAQAGGPGGQRAGGGVAGRAPARASRERARPTRARRRRVQRRRARAGGGPRAGHERGARGRRRGRAVRGGGAAGTARLAACAGARPAGSAPHLCHMPSFAAVSLLVDKAPTDNGRSMSAVWTGMRVPVQAVV